MFIVVIEHLEPCINRWLLAEYRYVAQLFKNRVVITNVRNPKHREILSAIAHVEEMSVIDLLKDRDDVVVLDPKAPQKIKASELNDVSYVIIGGIMGSHPPQGRTWKYITSKLPKARARSLGPYQLTIAGTAYVLKKLEEGKELNEIPMILGLKIERELRRGITHIIELPYAFPLNEHRGPALPPRYLEIVSEYAVVYEQRLLSGSYDYMCQDSESEVYR